MSVLMLIIPFVLQTTFAGNTYTVTSGDSHKQCVKCPPGSYVVKDCHQDDTNSTVCGACPTGDYTQAWNAYHGCKHCRTHCNGANEIMTAECKPDHDIVCGCPPGFWREKHRTPNAKCLPFLKCGKGYGVDKSGTNISDVTCIPCIKSINFSSIVSNSETCQPCRDCQKEGWNQTQSCTVIANAKCDVKTTSDPASSTSSKYSKSSTQDTPPTTDSLNISSIIASVCVVVIIVGIVIYVGCKCLKSRKKSVKTRHARNISHDNVIFRVNGSLDEESTGGSATSPRSENVRRRISNISLRSGITLENDVFPWLGRKLGYAYQNICKSLPGKRIVTADIEQAKHKFRDTSHLPDVIAEVFLIWKDKNALEKEEDDLFREIFNTLDARKDVFSCEMREEFLNNFT
ncbi:tumor necrosis factor receptor superfamily member 11B-like [Lineus longissimus]|uniref:tumor necrosis factor receptor superfamily member 11B-like n=1 Tax=Lineus longissimus TaxID=88925 RepID=UPI002B4ECDE5